MSVTDLFAQPGDATPLDAEEREGLLQTWITTCVDLNEAEQANIDDAMAWTGRRHDTELLIEGFVFELHKRMFGDVWSWAARRERRARVSVSILYRSTSNSADCCVMRIIGWIMGLFRQTRSRSGCIMGWSPSILFPTVTADTHG